MGDGEQGCGEVGEERLSNSRIGTLETSGSGFVVGQIQGKLLESVWTFPLSLFPSL